MNRLRDNFRTGPDGRATELDPSTFDHPEQYQPHPTGIDWFVVTVWLALFALSGLAWWGIVEGVKAAWNLVWRAF